MEKAVLNGHWKRWTVSIISVLQSYSLCWASFSSPPRPIFDLDLRLLDTQILNFAFGNIVVLSPEDATMYYSYEIGVIPCTDPSDLTTFLSGWSYTRSKSSKVYYQ